MAHTRSHGRRRNHRRTHRRHRDSRRIHRALLREVPSTVALLADSAHFARMRAYRSFAFDDHHRYLRHMEALLRTLAAHGTHTRVALFDPVDYERFCQEEHLAPDSAASRTRYATHVASAGASLPYRGQQLSRLIPALLDAHSHLRTRHAAAGVLARTPPCPRCGTDVADASFDRATRLLTALLTAAGDGSHHLVCSIAVPGTPLITTLEFHREHGGPSHLREAPALALTTALAAGLATASPGALVLRTHGRGGIPDAVRGWRVDPARGRLRPLTADEVRTAYCTDPATGAPLAPDPGVEHAPGLELPGPGGDVHC